MWGDCACGHHRNHHPWTGHRWAGCELCAVCHKPSDVHVMVNHQFQRCSCNEFREAS